MRHHSLHPFRNRNVSVTAGNIVRTSPYIRCFDFDTYMEQFIAHAHFANELWYVQLLDIVVGNVQSVLCKQVSNIHPKTSSK